METVGELADAEPSSIQMIEEQEEEQEFQLLTKEAMSDVGEIESEAEDEGREEESSPVQARDSDEESNHAGEGKEETENRGLYIDYEAYKEELDLLQRERESLVSHSGQLQMQLVEHFSKKIGEDSSSKIEVAEADHEQRYLKWMESMQALREEYDWTLEHHQKQIEELRKQMQEKVNHADDEWRAFMSLKKDAAMVALSRRLGRRAALDKVEQIQANEQRKENELIQVRTENIKLRNAMLQMEAQLAASTDTTGSLHLIDFEQLKIENQTYEEKIEERNEELMKLQRKVGRNVQMITHVTAKLQQLEVENQAQRKQRAELDMVVNGMRDKLTRTKRKRNRIRADSQQLCQSCGLLGKETLLKDFEEKVHNIEAMQDRVEVLKLRHADVALKSSKVKKKLEQVK